MQGNKNKAPTIIHTPEYARDCRDLKVFAIYPDYWGQDIKLERSFRSESGKTIRYQSKHNWGEPPCLGYVKEQDEHWAKIAAYTCGLVPTYNATFKPKAVLIKTKVGHKPWKKKKDIKKYDNPSNKV